MSTTCGKFCSFFVAKYKNMNQHAGIDVVRLTSSTDNYMHM